MMSDGEERSCSALTEYEVALALSASRCPFPDLKDQISTWLSRCCERCCEKKHAVLRTAELAALGGVPDPVDAWIAVEVAPSSYEELGDDDRQRLGFVVGRLTEEEERLRFNAPRQGLEAVEEAKRVLDDLEPPSARDRLVDSASSRLLQAEGTRSAARRHRSDDFGVRRSLIHSARDHALRHLVQVLLEGVVQLCEFRPKDLLDEGLRDHRHDRRVSLSLVAIRSNTVAPKQSDEQVPRPTIRQSKAVLSRPIELLELTQALEDSRLRFASRFSLPSRRGSGEQGFDRVQLTNEIFFCHTAGPAPE